MRRDVAAFAQQAGMDDEGVGSVKLAVSEAATNAVVHAYRDAPSRGRVSVRANCGDERIRVTVRDEGTGLAPRLDSPGLGLGLPLIAQMAHGSEVRAHEEGGTEVCIRFNLAMAEA